MKPKQSEYKYYFKIILIIAVFAALLFAASLLWQVESLQTRIVGWTGGIIALAYFIRAVILGNREQRRRNYLKLHGVPVTADFLDIELGSSHHLIFADYYLRVTGSDPETGEQVIYETSYIGENKEPDKKTIPKKILVYVDPADSSNYYIDLFY